MSRRTKYKMLLFETSRQAFRLGCPTFNYSKYPHFTFQTRQVQVFRLEYPIFLKMSKIYSQVFPAGFAIFLKMSKYYHETQSKFFLRIHNTFVKKSNYSCGLGVFTDPGPKFSLERSVFCFSKPCYKTIQGVLFSQKKAVTSTNFLSLCLLQETEDSQSRGLSLNFIIKLTVNVRWKSFLIALLRQF